MGERDLRDKKEKMDKEIDSLDEEIKEAEANKEQALKNKKELEGKEGEALRKAQAEIQKLDADYKRYEAERKAKSGERDKKAKQQRALQDQIAKLTEARTQKIGAVVDEFEDIAKKNERISSLERLEKGTALDTPVQRQYLRASCYRADLNHFWGHMNDMATSMSEKYARDLFKQAPKTFTEALPRLDEIMSEFNYDDPGLLMSAVEDFRINAESFRNELEARIDARGDGLEPSPQTVAETIVISTVDGMLFSVATQLKVLAHEGRLTQVGPGYSVERALDELSERFTLTDSAKSNIFKDELKKQQNVFNDLQKEGHHLDQCWEKMAESTLKSLNKETDKETKKIIKKLVSGSKIESRLKDWFKTISKREIDPERLMTVTSQVLIEFGQYRQGIENTPNKIKGRQLRYVDASLLEFRAIGNVFTSSMSNEIKLWIREGRI